MTNVSKKFATERKGKNLFGKELLKGKELRIPE
jgi:hypothetical protein